MISKIKLFVLDCFSWGRGYKQSSCCLLCVYYLYSHLVLHFLLDHVKLQDSKNHLRYSLPCPWKSVGTVAWSESITACSFSAAWRLELGYAFFWKSSRGSGQKFRQFLENLSIDFTELSENTKHSRKDTNWEKQNKTTKQQLKTNKHAKQNNT